ncbi:MAG TPA: hypothetical protein VJW20_13975 [Candidatus Angelobacter sp.]|nr:hypothetical protein [Candidatus Angelobacter sp.]
MRVNLGIFALLFAASLVAAQDAAPQWQTERVKDAFLGTESIQYRLEGKYLATPFTKPATPAIYLQCTPGSNNHGRYDGKLENAFLFVGDTADRHSRYERKTQTRAREKESTVVTQYRLDDGKVHTQYLGHSPDFKMISLQPEGCGECMINDLFYGHIVSHKENTSPQIKKVVFNIPDPKSGNVVIQFDLPDVTEVARTCGISHK